MSDIPEHILEQIHILAADGVPLEEISFMLRLDKEIIEEELRNPTVQVNTTQENSSQSAKLDSG